jgi:hypothetical protein
MTELDIKKKNENDGREYSKSGHFLITYLVFKLLQVVKSKKSKYNPSVSTTKDETKIPTVTLLCSFRLFDK